MDTTKWQELLAKKKGAGLKAQDSRALQRKKERRLIGYENARVSLKYVVVERFVDEYKFPDAMYIKKASDHRVLIDQLFADQYSFLESCKKHQQEGWSLESCHEIIERIVKTNIPEWFENKK